VRDPDPYKIITDPDPRGPKTYGSYGSGSGTLERTQSTAYHGYLPRTVKSINNVKKI
jgi:hypothetical protein